MFYMAPLSGNRLAHLFEDPAWGEHLGIEETTEGVSIHVDVPGVRLEDISIEMEGRTLVVTAERKGRMANSIKRSFSLPPTIDPTSISATCKDGVLAIDARRKEEALPRKIEVRATPS